jgi:hypothetical protein
MILVPSLSGRSDTQTTTVSDDIGPLSKVLEVISELNPFFKQDANLDFNLDKTKILDKGTTTQHVFSGSIFFQDNPDLQEIPHDFTLDMFTVEVNMSRVPSNYVDHLWSTTSTSRTMWITRIKRVSDTTETY